MIYRKLPLYLSRLGSLLQDYKNILLDFTPLKASVFINKVLYEAALSKVEPIQYLLVFESIGSSLGFEGELIWAGLDWRGHEISSGLVNTHLI